jgi:hypothetical protein
VIIEREKIDSDIDPIGFERPLSQAYWHSKGWNYEVPDSVLVSVEGLYAIRTLKPEGIKEASSAVLGSCDIPTSDISLAVIHVVSSPLVRKKQVEGFIGYADHIWDRALEARLIKSPRVHRPIGVLSLSTIRRQSAEPLLRDLEAMSKEEDEPDFLNRPTPFAHETAEKLIRDAYSHYVGSAPPATLGPDGDGGMVAEWQSGQRVVRLIVAPNKNAKTYIYRRANNESAVDHVPSGTILAQRLLTVFG